ncbi:MAG: hypothetical protein OXE78_01740 [Gammaproteobacteria bacterium]|nr:hypothetical protein [Gammaproteobacteria bacterium]
MNNFDEVEYRHRFAAWAASSAAMRGQLGLDGEAGKKIIEKAELNALAKGWEDLPDEHTKFNDWHCDKRRKIIEMFDKELEDKLKSDKTRKKIIKKLATDKKFKNKAMEEFDEERIEKIKSSLKLSHGRAAKLINVYMKVLFLSSVQDCMQQENRKIKKWIHPPVDRQLLIGIKKNFSKVKDRVDSSHDVTFLKYYPTRFNGKNNEGTPWTRLNSDQYQKIIKAFGHITGSDGLWTIEEYWPGHQ